MMETSELLREYALHGSETAFRQLVTQYVDLVYSTALRRVSGDSHRAEDVAQMVFTDLARKAKSLPEDVMLGGWLHKHCCFVASNMRRTEARRAAREKEAVIMDADANWSEAAPELDDAIESLEQEDRDAIVLRFFEGRDFRAIGAAIGGTENAAQKRVTRALEKLRHLLTERGVAMSVAALTAALSSQAIEAAPAKLADRASDAALEKTAGHAAAATAGGTGSLAFALWLCAGVLTAIIVVVSMAVSKRATETPTSTEPAIVSNATPQVSEPTNVPAVRPQAANSMQPLGTTAATVPGGPAIKLTILAADSGQPIPNVPIEVRSLSGGRYSTKTLEGSRLGICIVPYATNNTELQLVTQVEGFADTRLRWELKRGDVIPKDYTLKLVRGRKIGGKVLNDRGELVPGATVSLGVDRDPEANLRIESYEVDNVRILAEDGNWQTERVAESVVRRLTGNAVHPDYVESEHVHPQGIDNKYAEQMLAGTHVFRLKDPTLVRGIVVDEEKNPIGGAKILVGGLSFTGSTEGMAGGDGRFAVRGPKEGPTLLTASAKGYAATTLRIRAGKDEEHQVVLKRGRILKMRVVNKKGEPIPKANVWMDTNRHAFDDTTNDPPVQVQFSPRTDEEGRIFWEEAPADVLSFDVYAKGYMRVNEIKVPADGLEHTVTLRAGMRMFGTVKDAASGQPIPKFRIIGGYPSEVTMPGETMPDIHWSTIDRFWIQFTDGKFDYRWEEGIVGGVPRDRFIFKVEAQGYKPFVTRIVGEDEEEARFDVALKAGTSSMLTVLEPNGAPAANADVAFLTRRSMLRLSGASLVRNFNNVAVRSVDKKGQIKLEEEGVQLIVACSPAGFRMIAPAALGDRATLQLEPWGKVTGRLTKKGKPVEGKMVKLQSDFSGAGTVIMGDEVTSDAEGNFSIPIAPPGKFNLTRRSAANTSGGGWSNVKFKEVDIKPGETAVADFDDKSVPVKVRLVFPPDLQRGERQHIYCAMNTKLPGYRPDFISNPQAALEWRQRPEVQAAMRVMNQSQLTESEPGLWVGDITPGEWMLHAGVTIMPEKQGSVPTLPALTASMEVVAPENLADEGLDLGRLELKKAPPVTAP